MIECLLYGYDDDCLVSPFLFNVLGVSLVASSGFFSLVFWYVLKRFRSSRDAAVAQAAVPVSAPAPGETREEEQERKVVEDAQEEKQEQEQEQEEEYAAVATANRTGSAVHASAVEEEGRAGSLGSGTHEWQLQHSAKGSEDEPLLGDQNVLLLEFTTDTNNGQCEGTSAEGIDSSWRKESLEAQIECQTTPFPHHESCCFASLRYLRWTTVICVAIVVIAAALTLTTIASYQLLLLVPGSILLYLAIIGLYSFRLGCSLWGITAYKLGEISTRRVLHFALVVIFITCFEVSVVQAYGGFTPNPPDDTVTRTSIYVIGASTLLFRIWYFQMKTSCFHVSCLVNASEIKLDWFFSIAGWACAAVLASGTLLPFLPSITLLWLFTVQSVMWWYNFKRGYKPPLFLCDAVCEELNQKQIAMFNAKQVYMWILLAALDSTSNMNLTYARLTAYMEVLQSFKTLIFFSCVLESIGGGASKIVLVILVACFAAGLAVYIAAVYLNDSTLFNFCAYLFVIPEICADIFLVVCTHQDTRQGKEEEMEAAKIKSKEEEKNDDDAEEVQQQQHQEEEQEQQLVLSFFSWSYCCCVEAEDEKGAGSLGPGTHEWQLQHSAKGSVVEPLLGDQNNETGAPADGAPISLLQTKSMVKTAADIVFAMAFLSIAGIVCAVSRFG